MNYENFLQNLTVAGWSVLNRSFAFKEIDGEWQIAFVRLGGRFQLPGKVSFVVCIRHTSLRDREKGLRSIVKEPADYPFKLTLEELISGKLQYTSRLLQYPLSTIAMDSDWSTVFAALTIRIPAELATYTKDDLREEIINLGNNGYIEKIWAEDLA